MILIIVITTGGKKWRALEFRDTRGRGLASSSELLAESEMEGPGWEVVRWGGVQPGR